MRSLIGIRIAASPPTVFALARDVERWADILPHYRRVRPLRRDAGRLLAEYVALRPVAVSGRVAVPIVWRSWSWSDPAMLEISFRHQGGITDGMRVVWHIEPDGGGSHVTIEHRFERPLPLSALLGPGASADDLVPALVDRLVVRPIATLTLRALQRAAESNAQPVPAGSTAGDRPAVAHPGEPLHHGARRPVHDSSK